MTMAPAQKESKNEAYEDDETLKKGELEEEDVLKTYTPAPPDGGWGWVVVFASFMIHVLADGFTYTFGIFYVNILNYYGVSKSSASWIASILVGVTLGSGPISGTLVNRFGCRIVTIGGALIASFSLFVSIYATNVIVLYLTIGFGTGLGFGLIYLPAIVSVTSYFEKKRSFATGIAVCGSGIGTFAFSPFTEYLIEIYSWKGALIVISGLMLNCVVFGALFRPLEMSFGGKTQADAEEDSDRLSLMAKANNVSLTDIPTIKWATAQQIMKRPAFIQKLLQITNSTSCMNPKFRINVVGDIPRNCSHSCLESRVSQLKKPDLRLSSSQPYLSNSQTAPIMKCFGSQGLSERKRASIYGSGLLNRRDIFYGSSLRNIEQYKQDPNSYRFRIIRVPSELSGDESRTKMCQCVPCSEETRDTLSSLMDWSLMSDGIFLLFVFSNFCTSIGFNAPYIFTVDRAMEMGIDSERASYLLSIVGISNTISRVVLGYMSDKSWVNRLYLYNIALTACGLGTCFSIWFTGFVGQAFYAAIFGSTAGAYVGLTSVVLVDLLGMEKLTNAFGLLLLFQGIAALIGPPVCGALYDMSKSYDYSFLLAGFMIAISGIMLFFIPCIQKLQSKKNQQELESGIWVHKT